MTGLAVPAVEHGAAEPDPGDDFYRRLPVFRSFAKLTDPAIYAPLPAGWVLGLSDIVRSTAAIEAGHYKTVNTAAAAVIAAVANALGGGDFPFVFGGDGASFALPPEQAEKGRVALAAVAAFVRDEFALDLRVAIVPIEAVRTQGLDVAVARYAPSANVSYAMFMGGGLAWAEKRMKAGAFAIAPDSTLHPDLTGLSCRFAEIPSQRGVILSLIALPAAAVDPDRFRQFIAEILALAEGGADVGRPLPEGGPAVKWPPAGFDLEAKTARAKTGKRFGARLGLMLRTFGAYLIFRTGLHIGGFDPARYRRELVDNTDFRKFDDGLRMTLDCAPALADRLEDLLRKAEADGVAVSGTHRQSAALLTCFVPAATRSDHIHFVDGAMGGYSAAARVVKQTA